MKFVIKDGGNQRKVIVKNLYVIFFIKDVFGELFGMVEVKIARIMNHMGTPFRKVVKMFLSMSCNIILLAILYVAKKKAGTRGEKWPRR
jgi:hypothetical protein